MDPARNPHAPPVGDATLKRSTLEKLQEKVAACRLCALFESRTNTVFGDGDPDSRLMFVGEAPGYHEDQRGIPFVGRAGKLLDDLLRRLGLRREVVYIANVLKCRPPENRDPQTSEIEQCRSYLEQQVAAIEPGIVCTLGNFSTKLLSGKPDGISRVHGVARPFPGFDTVRLYPVFHPAAALYTPANLKALEQDFDRLGEMLDEDTVAEQPEQLDLF